MKILMILDREFPRDLRVENEMEALSEAGHEIHIACFTREDRPGFEKTDHWHIHRKNISRLSWLSSVAALRFPTYFNFWRKFLNDIVIEFSIDAVHVHDLPLVQVGMELKQKHNIMLTADLHENWPAYLRISQHTKSLLGRFLSPYKKWVKYEKQVLQEADNIIVVVDEAKQRLEKSGLDPDRIHVVSNTLNLKHFSVSEIPRNDSDIILYYAGGLNHHRGLHIVIKALAAVKDAHPYLKFWILGKGNYTSRLKDLSAELGLDDRVVFHGWVPFGKMTEMLMQADFALIPHLRSEHTDSTIPHKLFQYMYSKKPIIASNCKPIERIVNETGCGYIYQAKDVHSLSRILAELKQTDHRSMAEKGYKAVVDKYNFKTDAAVLTRIYSE